VEGLDWPLFVKWIKDEVWLVFKSSTQFSKEQKQNFLKNWKEEGAQKTAGACWAASRSTRCWTTTYLHKQPSQATNVQKHINENELSGIYSKLMYIKIAKLNALLKKLTRPFFVLIITNEQRLSALNDTGADVCCMSSKTFRRVFPVRQQPEKLNPTSSSYEHPFWKKIRRSWNYVTKSQLKWTKDNYPEMFMSLQTKMNTFF